MRYLALVLPAALLALAGCAAEPRGGTPADLNFHREKALEISRQAETRPLSNAEIRQWYLHQTATIPMLNKEWIRQGITSPEQRARMAWSIRHEARLKSREWMTPADRELVRARDAKVYGNPDGPTFEWLVAKNRAKGLKGDEVYEEIIHSAARTNESVNAGFGLSR